MAKALLVVRALALLSLTAVGCPFAPVPAPCLADGNCPDELLCVAGFCDDAAAGEGEGEGEGEDCLELPELIVNDESDLAILVERPCVRILGDLEIANLFELEVEGLQPVIAVGGDLRITSNTALRSLTGLAGLVRVNGSLVIEANTALTDVSALLGVIVDGDVRIAANISLGTCEAQALADAIAVNGLGGQATVEANRFDACS